MLTWIMWKATMNAGTLFYTLCTTTLATSHSLAQDANVIRTQAQ